MRPFECQGVVEVELLKSIARLVPMATLRQSALADNSLRKRLLPIGLLSGSITGFSRPKIGTVFPNRAVIVATTPAVARVVLGLWPWRYWVG